MFWPYSAKPATHNLGDAGSFLRAQRLWWSAAETGFFATLTVQARAQQMAMAMLTGSVPPHAETWRMMSEKPAAALESWNACCRAAIRADADADGLLGIAEAGLRPYRRKTRLNARRLQKSAIAA